MRKETRMDKAERKKLAHAIVKAIKLDFTDRRGLRQEWDAIDGQLQREIVREWTTLVMIELDRSLGPRHPQ